MTALLLTILLVCGFRAAISQKLPGKILVNSACHCGISNVINWHLKDGEWIPGAPLRRWGGRARFGKFENEGKKDFLSRIINGESARPHQFPWIVGLYRFRNDRFPVCMGALISDRHVVTAAHCPAGRNTQRNKKQLHPILCISKSTNLMF